MSIDQKEYTMYFADVSFVDQIPFEARVYARPSFRPKLEYSYPETILA